MAVTVRGRAKVTWSPAYTLTFQSTDGLTLEPSSGSHPLIATLTLTSDGSPVVNRKIKLTTNPVGRVGHGIRGTTNGDGQVVFQVSNVAVESVIYTASLIPNPPTSEPTVTADLTIAWGGVVCSTCNADIDGSPPAVRPSVANPQSLGWIVHWTVRTTSGDGCLTITEVTHSEGFFLVFPGAPPVTDDAEVQSITQEDSPFLTDPEIDAIILDQTPEYDALVADLQADQC